MHLAYIRTLYINSTLTYFREKRRVAYALESYLYYWIGKQLLFIVRVNNE